MAKSIKSGDNIPDEDHVVRYCSPKHLDGTEVSETAFLLRDSEECLSFDWLEFFGDSKSDQQRFKAVHEAVSNRLTTKPSGRLVRISVGKVKGGNENISVKYSPKENSKSHAEICPYAKNEHEPMDRLEFALALAREVTPDDIFPAK